MIHPKTQELQKRVIEYIQHNMPIVANNGKTLSIEDLTIKDPDGIDDITKQLEIKYTKKGSLEGWVRGRVVIKDKNGKVISKSRIMNLIPIPYATERGTYLINGTEKQILNQMRLKPGSYTVKNNEKNEIKTSLMFAKSTKAGMYLPPVHIVFNPAELIFKITVNSRPKFEVDGITFLRQLGFTDPDIRKMLGNNSVADLLFEKYGKRNTKTIEDIYKAFTGKTSSKGPTQTRQALFDFFQENALFQTGSAVIQRNLGVSNSTALNKEIIRRAVTKTFAVAANSVEPDVKDDIKYKDVYSDIDLLMEQVEKDVDEFIEKSKEKLEKEKNIEAEAFSPILKLGNGIKNFLSTSSLVQTPEMTNPLFVEALGRKITQLGEGGLSADAARNEFGARNLTISGVNKVDPIETPESGNIGFVQHLTQNAKIKDKTLYIPVYKVKNGTAILTDSNKVELSTLIDQDHKIAFYDTRYLKVEGNKLTFTAQEVPGRYKDKIVNIPVDEIEFVDSSPQNVLGTAANAIPFVMHNDGVRALMGTNMQKQSIVLANREAPLVTTLADDKTGKTYDEVLGEKYGKPVYSQVDGVVEKILDSKIIVRGNDGKKYEHQFYYYFPLNQSYLNNELKVKVGDNVKKGQMLAEGWQSKDGKLALGVNARIGYLPYDGYNYEDGVVVSESFAKKMATDETDEVEIEIPKDYLGGRGSNIQSELIAYTSNPEVRQKLDKDGIIKVGEYVKPGSILVATLRPLKEEGPDAILTDIIKINAKKIKYEYKPFKIEQNSYVEGKVVRVTVVDNPDGVNKQKIILTLVTSKPLKLGDKISGRHGNKGTITKILPDHLMPVTEDGKKLDLLFSPLAIPSRKNLGQLFEANAGLLAEKTGQRFVVNNFDHTQKDKVLQGLKEIGIPEGKMKVFIKKEMGDGTIKEIPTENPITVGNMYIMKLKHKVDDKIQARTNLETSVGLKDHMPSKRVGGMQGEKANPQSLGEMEMRALQAHGAVWNVLENTTIKADGGGDNAQRVAMFKAISTGKLDPADLDVPATPENLKVLTDSLKALGLNVRPLNNSREVKSFNDVFDSLAISPLKSSDFIKMVGEQNEVYKHDLFNARDLFNESKKKEDDKNKKKKKKKQEEELPIEEKAAVRGGLLDPEIFGKVDTPERRNKWGYIKLATPIPNPVLMQDKQYNPYAILTGIGVSKLQELVGGKKVMIIDPKTYRGFDNLPETEKQKRIAEIEKSMKAANVKPGDFIKPEDLEKLISQHGQILWKVGGEGLQHILDQIDIDKEIKNTKALLDKAEGADIDTYYKKYRTLLNLKNNKMTASDLMMHYLPVAPAYLRPVTLEKDNKTVIVNDLNKLYANIIKANNPAKVSIENGFDLMSSLPPLEAAKITGNIYNKVTQLTGHVQGSDAKSKKPLKGFKDEIGGKDGIVRGKMLSKRVDFSGRSVIGVDPNLNINEVGIPMDMAKEIYKPFIIKGLLNRGLAANEFEARQKLKNYANDPDVKEVIKAVASDRPVIINRQPSLHKFSIQALKPVIKEVQDGMPVRSIHLNPLVVTGFNADFDGDTMAVHVPVTEEAKEEAKRLMMPSNNLVNPTNGKLIIEIRHEMALGIYYLTLKYNQPEGQAKTYMRYKDLEKDYFNGNIKARQKVNIGDAQGVTAGQALFNLLLPKQYRNYKKTWGSKDVNAVIEQMYKDAEKDGFKKMSLIQLSSIIDKIKRLGFKAATISGVSIGTSDFKKMEDAKAIFEKHIAEAKKNIKDPEKAEISGWQKAEKEIEKILGEGEFLEEENPLQIMMASGARAKKDQIRRMMISVGVGMDTQKNLVVPIKESHFDGLSPQDYFRIGFDSRKGIMDRSVSTRDPGTLSREVWSATQDIIVKEADCQTREGVTLNASDKTIRGRYLAQDIISENGKIIAKRNQMITDDVIKAIDANNIKTVVVRSPLRCKTVHGVCQRCYGALPGTLQPIKIGTAVGVLASQALGEPVTQMTMNTFHSGGANSSATLGLPRVKDILNLSADKSNGAILAKVSGKVERIEEHPFETVVYVNQTPHKVPNSINGERKPLKVKVGDIVTKGDFITVGDIDDLRNKMDKDDPVTHADPKELFKLKKNQLGQEEALKYTQDYLTDAMQYAFQKTVPDSLDRKHMETMIAKLTSKVKVIDPGQSKYIKGDVIDKNEADRWNSLNPSLKPIKYEAELYSKNSVVTKGHDNWFSNLGHQDVYKQLARGATFGQVDKINDPRSRLMAGKLLNVGEGYNITQKLKDISNGISTSMYNFFTKDLKKELDKIRK